MPMGVDLEGANVKLQNLKQNSSLLPRRRRSELMTTVVLSGCIVTCLGWIGTATPSHAQSSWSQLVPASRQELADEERPGWSLAKFPSQAYMNEVFWNFPKETPAFFSESMLQFVGRSYYFTKDNFDVPPKSQAWAGGGWIAFRSGLIGNMFGVHTAYY